MTGDQHHDWNLSIGNEPVPDEAKPVTATASAATPASTPSSQPKTVLLVDTNSRTRESRAKIMRGLGVAVDCVSTAAAAIAVPGSYNMVLIDLGRDLAGAEQLADEFRARNPRQLVAFLIGSPLFVATSLKSKNARRTRVSSAQPASPVPEAPPPAPKRSVVFDFGQKIRDAEADKTV